MSSLYTSIGVVFGGASGEHDVSIKSAITVVNALRAGKNSHHFKVIPIYIDLNGHWHDSNLSNKVLIEGLRLKVDGQNGNFQKGLTKLPKETEKIEVWYPVLHGPNGEDGTIQGLFTLMKKPFVGSNVLGSAVGMDKLAMKAIFTAAGLSQVPYAGIKAEDLKNQEHLKKTIARLENKLTYPYFVKPANLGSSVGISKVKNREELLKGLDIASKYDKRLVVEQGIDAIELECGVLGKSELVASTVGEIKYSTDWYNYETKYSKGFSEVIIPAKIEESLATQVKMKSIEACNALGVNGMARVDFFYRRAKNELLINEVNTLPGFTSQSMYPRLWQASGVTLEKLVARLIETATE